MLLLTYLLIFVEILTCILLIGVILLQRSRGGGAGMAFGAGMGESLFGAQAGTVLSKTTVVLGIIFLVNTTILAMIGSVRREASVADRVRPAPAVPSMPQEPVPQAQELPFDSAQDDLFIPESPVPPAIPEGSPAEMPPVDDQEVTMPLPPVVDELPFTPEPEEQ